MAASTISIGNLAAQIAALMKAVLAGSSSSGTSGTSGSTGTSSSGVDLNRPATADTQLVQYDGETAVTALHTVIDPIVVSRRARQIEEAGAMNTAAANQQLVYARLTAQAAAAGLPIGTDAGRYMGRFKCAGQVNFGGGNLIERTTRTRWSRSWRASKAKAAGANGRRRSNRDTRGGGRIACGGSPTPTKC